MKKDKYLHLLNEDQKPRHPLPYLLAKKNKKRGIPFEEKQVQNSIYGTNQYLSFSLFKNIITPLPPEAIEKLKMNK